jgi:hypothetical protein
MSVLVAMVIIIENVSFSDAFRYPFKKPKRLLYALFLLIPIFGWLILFGYLARLVNEFIEGRYEGPIKLNIMDDMSLGFTIFLKSLPFIIVYVILISAVSYVSETFGILLNLLLSFFIIPILQVNFYRKQTIESYFEFDILNIVKDNLGSYVVAILKQYALAIIFLVLSVVLIGIPALIFTGAIFTANFYGKCTEAKNIFVSTPEYKDQVSV